MQSEVSTESMAHGAARWKQLHDEPAAEERPNRRRRVAAYCRVSTDRDMQEGSFEMQVSHYTETINARPDMVLVEVYGDKGKTGRNISARPAFMRMIEQCEAGNIDVVVTKSISRFARNMAECVAVVRRLKGLGIPVIFEKEGLNSMAAGDELTLMVFAAIAQEESNSISQSQLWANEQRNAEGRPNFKPSYGYTKARGDWEWHIDEEQAGRVRLAFKLAAEGRRYGEIRSALNEMEEAAGKEPEWTHRRLKYLLTNENYTGNCLTNKNVSLRGMRQVKVNEGERAQYRIEGHHEPLVSREVFELVQRRIESGDMSERAGNKPGKAPRKAAAAD